MRSSKNFVQDQKYSYNFQNNYAGQEDWKLRRIRTNNKKNEITPRLESFQWEIDSRRISRTRTRQGGGAEVEEEEEEEEEEEGRRRRKEVDEEGEEEVEEEEEEEEEEEK